MSFIIIIGRTPEVAIRGTSTIVEPSKEKSWGGAVLPDKRGVPETDGTDEALLAETGMASGGGCG